MPCHPASSRFSKEDQTPEIDEYKNGPSARPRERRVGLHCVRSERGGTITSFAKLRGGGGGGEGFPKRQRLGGTRTREDSLSRALLGNVCR